MAFEIENQQNNDLGHPNDALIPRPELPPRLTTTVQRSPPPHVSNQNIFAVLLKNKRQITSLTAGLIVLLGSGVHTVWAFWAVYSIATWHEVEILYTVGSWYVATIIGTAIATPLIPKWSKKSLYILAAILLLISSILFISRIFVVCRIDNIILFGRILGGLANGIAYMTVITHAAENAVNQIRGVILRSIGYVLAFSLFIAGATTYEQDGNTWKSEYIMGFVNLFYSMLAIISAFLLTIESAPHLLRQTTDDPTIDQSEKLVIETMVKLRNEKDETPKIRHDFIEMKHQLNEDELDSRNPLSLQNIRPLCIVIGVRVLSVCAKNLPFSILIMLYFNHILRSQNFSENLLFLLLSCRFICGISTMFFIDKFERKKYLYISSIICGILVLAMCLVIKEDTFLEPSFFSYGIIIFFVFASMSIDCVGHVQTSEAFSYATKSWSITIATAIEHTIHMVFISLFIYKWNITTFILISIGLILFGLSTLLTVPAKTKGLSLRQTRDIYRKVKFVFNSEDV